MSTGKLKPALGSETFRASCAWLLALASCRPRHVLQVRLADSPEGTNETIDDGTAEARRANESSAESKHGS